MVICTDYRHGEFSRLDGVGTAKEAAEAADKLGHGFLAQTDHGTLSGALHHIVACREKGIVPITGVEAYYRPNRKWRAPIIKPHEAWHLVLLVKNLRGWHNLLRLVSIAYAEQDDGGGFYQYPCVDDELLDKYSEGLIATSACFQSWLARLIDSGDSVATRDYVQTMKNRFGDDFYLEIMPHDFDEQRLLNNTITDLSYEYSVPLIATSDAHFVYPEWAETQRVSKMMATKLTFSKVEQMIEKGEEPPYTSELHPTLYISSHDEMHKWFIEYHPDLNEREIDEALDNTAFLASTIKPFLLDRSDKLPKITENPDDAEQILSGWIDQGFEQMRKEYPQSHWEKWSLSVYEERIDYEWNILKDKGAIQYMVMVGDICRMCRDRGIRYGVRGSAAGCLISRLVGISVLDPIPWGLLFERFLNPGRKGLPDIDIDVQSDRRAEVKQYVIDKYGADHVADIITHERFQPKSVLQRLCAVFDVPYIEAKKVTDTIDIRQDDEETKLEELLPLNETLREFKGKYPNIWEHALRLEGTVANFGKHAAGVVITPKPITEYMALERGKKGDLVTSWSDAADFMVITDYGFIKIDLLGLQGLQRHGYACKLIKERHGLDIELDKLDPARDPREIDPEVMQIFTEGHTSGIFQFGSKGMTGLLKQMHPDNVLDLTAANALYRPGPMNGGVTWDYARIKRGDKEPPEWTQDPIANEYVWPVLGETYGLIAYQEQVMEVAKRMGGFTPAQADNLRKAMGKLYRIKGHEARKFMQGFWDTFKKGCADHKIPDETRDTVWNMFLGFGAYGFNKSLLESTFVERYTTNQYEPDPNITLREIWERFYGSKKNKPVGEKYRHRGLWIRGYDKNTGRITKKHVIDIHDHGVLPLYKITLENGLSISATLGHRHMTPDGWRKVIQLSVGDELLFDTKVQDATRESAYRVAFVRGIGSGWAASVKSRSIANDGSIRPILHGHHSALALVTKELPDYCEFCNAQNVPLERAHLNNDRTDNSRENVKHLCNSCHKAHDGHLRGGPWSRGSISSSSKIISIEYNGEHQTYDLEVEGETDMDHNYVANGIVTHNSHSGYYSFQAYQDAWLKKNFPLEFYASILTYPSGGTPAAKNEFIDKMAREAKTRGIKFLPPDINSSELGWIIDDEGDGEGLRFNLVGIKDVGAIAASKIIINRGDGFWSIDEVRERCGSKVNKKVIEALTEAGAFDSFGARKGWSGRQIAMYEKERLRMVIKGTQETDKYADLIRPNIYTDEEVEALPNGEEAIIGGEITKVEIKQTKNGNPFANVTVAFEMNEWRVKLWSNALAIYEDMLEIGKTVMVSGKKDEWNGFISIICSDMRDLSSFDENEREEMMA